MWLRVWLPFELTADSARNLRSSTSSLPSRTRPSTTTTAMSATPALTKKQQKALKHHASASGAPKASTSAAAEASAPSAGAGDDDAAVADPLSLLPRGKKTKNKRKIARAEKEGEDVIGDEEEETMGEEQEERRVVKKRKVAEGGAAATEGGKATKVEGAKDGEDKKVAEKPKPKQKQRFILFVGQCSSPDPLELGSRSSDESSLDPSSLHLSQATFLSRPPAPRWLPSSRSTSSTSLRSVCSPPSPTQTQRERPVKAESRAESPSRSESPSRLLSGGDQDASALVSRLQRLTLPSASL